MNLIWIETIRESQCEEILWEIDPFYWAFQYHHDMAYSSAWFSYQQCTERPLKPNVRDFVWWVQHYVIHYDHRVFNTREEADTVWIQLKEDPLPFIVLATLQCG